MRKAEILVQRDTYVESSWARQNLNNMYDILKANMRYVKEVLGFMNFDADQIHSEGPRKPSHARISD